jgi:transposase
VIPAGVEVFIGLEPIDLRWGLDRLAGVVTEQVGRDPRGGALFVFFGRRRDKLKLVFHDGTGMCLFYKRLDQGQFLLPAVVDEQATTVTLTEDELSTLLEGVVLVEKAPRRPRRRLH